MKASWRCLFSARLAFSFQIRPTFAQFDLVFKVSTFLVALKSVEPGLGLVTEQEATACIEAHFQQLASLRDLLAIRQYVAAR